MVEAINKAHYEKALLIRRTEDTFLDLFNEGSFSVEYKDNVLLCDPFTYTHTIKRR